jgi:hypothetical protein
LFYLTYMRVRKLNMQLPGLQQITALFLQCLIPKRFYYLSDQWKRTFVRIYLKKGDKISLQINEDGYELTEFSPENKVLKQWVDESYPVVRMAVFPRKDTATYRSFFPALNAYLPKAESFKKKINTQQNL